MKYDYIIVGCGLFGSVIAQRCIEQKKRILIIDKRNHIAGNCYTEKVNNIDVHKYGPHIFHTNNDKIWDYVNRFAQFNNFVNRPKVSYNNKIYSFPINLFTLYQLWGVSTPQQAQEKLDQVKVNIPNPSNLEEWILSQVGEEIYHIFIKGYTTKQWNTDPKNLPASIIKRLPIRLNFDDNYFMDKYQGIPINGYTDMVNNMIQGADIILNENYFDKRNYWDSQANVTIYTGPIDKFFDYQFGPLAYRSLRFETTNMDIEDYQGNAIVNFTQQDIAYTRSIEHKHFNMPTRTNKTIITKEYPDNYTGNNEPYYPINTDINQKTYNKYYQLTKNLSHQYLFGGRLAEYRYYDMHQVIGSALSTIL